MYNNRNHNRKKNNPPKDNFKQNPSTAYKKKDAGWSVEYSDKVPEIGENAQIAGYMRADNAGNYSFHAMATTAENEDFTPTHREDSESILDKDRHEEPRPADVIKGMSLGLGTLTDTGVYIGLNDLNELYDALKDAAVNSTTNASSIELKHTMVVGSGFIFKEENSKKNEALIKKYRVRNIYKKSVLQFIGFGNTFVKIDKATKACEFEVLDCAFTKLKFVKIKADTYEAMPSEIGFSYEFYEESGITATDKTIIDYPIYPDFKTEKHEEDNGEEIAANNVLSSIIHLKNETIGRNYLGLPSWYAGRIAAKADYSIGRTNLNKFENGMKPDYLILIEGGNPNSPEQNAMLKKMEQKLKGLKNTGRTMIFHAPAGSTKITFIKISGDLDGDYLKLWEQVKYTIAQSQKLSPALAGIAVAGKLGDLQSLRLDFELLNNGVITKMQQDFIEEVLMPIFETIDEIEGSTMVDDFIGIKSAPPLSYKTELKPADYTKVNEARTMNGLAEDPEMEGKYINQNLQSQAPETPQTIQ